MQIKSFTEIESWKEARILVKEVYRISNEGEFLRDRGLKDQIQRAAVSVMSNIAEGFDGRSSKTFINFLNYSYRSASEVESLCFVALDLNYISEEQFNTLRQRITKIKNLIIGFISYLEKQT